MLLKSYFIQQHYGLAKHGIMPQLFVQKKISFNAIKNCKKAEIAYNFKLQPLFNTILTLPIIGRVAGGGGGGGARVPPLA